MDREKLFHGKRVDNGEWVEGFYYKDIWGDNTEYIIYDGDEYEIIPETVGEYTELDTDEKTTPLFKNDVVKFDDGNVCFTGRVGKECGAWGIIADNIPLDYANMCHNDNFISFLEIMWNDENPDLILDDVVPYVEVIGNIHDTPELLEVQ